MDRSIRLAAFLLVLVLMGTEMGPTIVAGENLRTCDSPSGKFKGPCIISSNCALTCQKEGFAGGHCRDFLRKCYCAKPC
ncbi:putative defensin, plant [Rosa chinensis]|uniref:Putative defensin, plant n=1 Tax=Rosa chinensis TaxID=74649 RepID=A0A2P6RQW7_ROSCH|nr:putative defensin, plant [Rosa chinensis]